MKVVVISDTHSHNYQDLPQQLRAEIPLADAVIHAGDIGTPSFYQELISHSKKLYAVRGNNDTYDVPPELIFTLEDVKIGVIHGDRAQGNRENYLLYHFAQENLNLIIFGHSHKPLWVQSGEQTLLNPGSPTRNRGTGYNTFVILTIDGEKFDISYVKC